jgi:hypothetical protein
MFHCLTKCCFVRHLLTLSRMLVILSMIHASGLGLNATQAYAWSTMLCRYSQDYGLKEGWQRTFDGEHPCKLCCCIKKVRQKSSTLDGLTNLSLHEVRLPIPEVKCRMLIPPPRPGSEHESCTLIGYRYSLSLWSYGPSKPPPRIA